MDWPIQNVGEYIGPTLASDFSKYLTVSRLVNRMLSFGNISGNNAVAFDPVEDIPPLDGKAILVTGGSSGLGKQAITYVA